jgi:hypothetical protein
MWGEPLFNGRLIIRRFKILILSVGGRSGVLNFDYSGRFSRDMFLINAEHNIDWHPALQAITRRNQEPVTGKFWEPRRLQTVAVPGAEPAAGLTVRTYNVGVVRGRSAVVRRDGEISRKIPGNPEKTYGMISSIKDVIVP